ncbi:MAG: glutaredoxin family protein [Candidatus Competibacteraceae bacterium]
MIENCESLALILYVTCSCHLCEQAEELLLQVEGVNVALVEVADDPELLERYGSRIPVLRRPDTDSELDWPFALDTIRCLLAG